MPFQSLAQMRAAFAGKLGPSMQARAHEWADATPNIKDLPEHKTQAKTKKSIVKKLVKKHTGKGGMPKSPFAQASSPINLLSMRGTPPTATSIPKSKNNSLGKQ